MIILLVFNKLEITEGNLGYFHLLFIVFNASYKKVKKQKKISKKFLFIKSLLQQGF